MKRVEVEVWSDFVCPWCWIAKIRLEKAAKSLSREVKLVVSYRAYRLARGMASENFKIALYNKFGSRVTAEGMMDAVAANGAMEGLVYNFDSMRFGDTTDAHVLVKSISSGEARSRLIERLFAASTTEGLDIFDRGVLRTIAGSIGLSETPIDFDDAALVSEVARDERRLSAVGSGVPLFVFNGKSFVSGAQREEVFRRALLQAAVDADDVSEESGASCSIDGGCN